MKISSVFTAIAFTLASLYIPLKAQTILNGSFENNGGACLYNIPNATYNANMQNSIGFGMASQLDIISSGCGYGAAQSGNWFVGMAIDITGAMSDAFSLQLSAPLSTSATYTLTYYDRKDPGYATNPLEIGLSGVDSLFGTQIFFSPVPVLGWTQHSITFTPTFAAQYITVHVVGNAYSWTHVDNFSLTIVSSPLQANANVVNASCTGICNGSATVNAAGGTAPYQYLWLPGGDTTVTVDSLCAGTYIVNVTDSLGTQVSDTVVVSASGSLTVDLGNDTSICSGQSLLLDAGNSGAAFLWQDNSTNQTLVINHGGSYWVNVSNGGCSASDTIQVSFITTPVLNIGNDTSFCSPDTILLNATLVGATSYQWQDNSTISIYTVRQSGNYSVSVSVSGCVVTDSININVNALPQAQLTADTGKICSNDSAQICAPSGFASYQWNMGQSTHCIYAKTAGNYYVTVTDNNGCSAESNHVHISVYPQPPVSITQNGDTLIVYNAVSVQWYLGGQAISGATSNIYITTVFGEYTVAITDTNGCSITSNPLNYTGIASVADDKITVYPNPSVDGSWYLEISNDLVGSAVEILDDNGRLIYRAQISNLKSQIGLNVARGVYLMRVYSGNYSFVRKLIRM